MDYSFLFPRNCISLSREALAQDSLHLICAQCSTNILGAELSPVGLSSQGMLGLPGPLSWYMVLSPCSLQACSPRHQTLHGIACQKPAPRTNPGVPDSMYPAKQSLSGGILDKGPCWLMQHPGQEFQRSRAGTTVFSEYYSCEEERAPIKLKYESEGLPAASRHSWQLGSWVGGV